VVGAPEAATVAEAVAEVAGADLKGAERLPSLMSRNRQNILSISKNIDNYL